MKISTLTALALLTASPFTAPNHTTALDGLAGRAGHAAFNAAPVTTSPAGVSNGASILREHWTRIELPKPRGLASRFAAREPREKT